MALVGPLDEIAAGRYLRIWIDLAGIAPTEANIASALAGRFNVVSVRRGLFSGEVEVTVLLQADTIAGEIGREIASVIESGFMGVIDADPVRYETLFSPPQGKESPGTPVTTTIAISAIAVIAVIGFGVFRRVT